MIVSNTLNTKQIAHKLEFDVQAVTRRIGKGQINALKKGKSYLSTEKALEHYEFIKKYESALSETKRKAKVISFTNHKGGVAKSTLSYSIAGQLSKINGGANKVLMIDLDTQGNSTATSIAPNRNSEGLIIPFERTIKDLILCQINNGMVTKELFDETIKESLFGFDMIPCDLTFNSIVSDIENTPYKEILIKDIIKQIEDRYDYVIIDTPPTLGFNVRAAITASDYVTIVTTPETYSVMGIEQTYNLIKTVKRDSSVLKDGKDVEVLGISINLVEANTKVTKFFVEQIHDYADAEGLYVFDELVTKNTKMKESQHLQELITNYDPDSTTSVAIFNTALEIDKKIKGTKLKDEMDK